MYHVSDIMYHGIAYHVSRIMYQWSCIICIMSSCIACIMYHVSCNHVSCVSCIMYHVSVNASEVSCIMYHVSCIRYQDIMYHVSCICIIHHIMRHVSGSHVSCIMCALIIMYRVSCIMYQLRCLTVYAL
jgi:hypothetical protein